MSKKQSVINKIAQQHDFSETAVTHVWEALRQGQGTMAQFNHPELGGQGQWMAGGMVMIGDMFNNQLKARVDALCQALSPLVIADLQRKPDAAKKKQAQASTDWWPAKYGQPNATGGQNERRYAYFAAAKRLVVEEKGRQSIYNTGKHQIHGFSQQQGALQFNSQLGTFGLGDLKLVKE